MERLIKKIIVMVCFIISVVLCSNTMQAADIVPWSKTEDGKFVNGNGHMGRLILNLFLMKNSYIQTKRMNIHLFCFFF